VQGWSLSQHFVGFSLLLNVLSPTSTILIDFQKLRCLILQTQDRCEDSYAGVVPKDDVAWPLRYLALRLVELLVLGCFTLVEDMESPLEPRLDITPILQQEPLHCMTSYLSAPTHLGHPNPQTRTPEQA
jgi:hypothetical protein